MKISKILLLVALLFSTVVARGQIRAHYINVGQADSILVEFRGAAILIDAGGDMIVTKTVSPAVAMARALLARTATRPSFKKLVDAAALRILEAKHASGLLPC